MIHAGFAKRPATWAVSLALALIYVSWGTTNFAIKEGVKSFPPFLFAGMRVAAAGLVLLGYMALRGQRLRIGRHELLWMGLAGVCLFLFGNGLLTVAAKTLPSGLATVLVATTPLFLALLEALWPRGERLNVHGWLGLIAGLAGLLVLMAPKLQNFGDFLLESGPWLALASAFMWAVGSFLLRHRPQPASHLASAAYQMLIGGISLVVTGVALGETRLVGPESFTQQGVAAFFYLLLVGSLIGFIAYNWLLANVSAVLAGTYAYVNPLVAIVVGWQLGGEELSGWIVGGMLVILAGVALVRFGGVRHRPIVKPLEPEPVEQWECEGVSA